MIAFFTTARGLLKNACSFNVLSAWSNKIVGGMSVAVSVISFHVCDCLTDLRRAKLFF